MNKRTHLLLVALAGGSLLAGCGVGAEDGTTNSASNGAVGQVALALQIGNGLTVNTFSYSLTGPNPRMGSINVSNSTTVSTLLSGVPAGTGYGVSLNGTATDGKTTCSGTSGSFNVTAGSTTPVTVNVSCKTPGTTGSVLINGTINVCASVGSVSAAPPVGTSIAITSSASDSDAGPGALQYSWTTNSGTLSSATVANPTLNCTKPGPVSLTLTVTDGDPACSDSFNVQLACPPDSALGESAWVEIGASNQAIARLITPYTVCPSITVDGATSPMNLRVGPATIAVRPTSTDPTLAGAQTSGNSKASVFPVSTCEFNIPAGAVSATVAGKALPLPKTNVQRIVVVGDTGCRISIGNVYQACGDPTQWPFSVISTVAANMKPDLVVHVGDYQYRDNPCPADQPQCTGTPWGYGYDTWYADLFQPAAPLLATAPWLMVRGNHETCNRAGQGWYRFLDPNPYAAAKSCDDPANDDSGNYNDPWAITVDSDTQFIAFDSANTSKSAYAPATKPADVVPFNNYTAELTAAGVFSANTSFLSIFAVHHPILGFTPVAGAQPTGGNPGMLSVMNAKYGQAYYPPGVGLAMHGHVHDFQGISFSSGHPATFVAGHGGDNLDAALPASVTAVPAAGTVIGQMAYTTNFGFLVMDRLGAQDWSYTAYKTDGTVLTRCTQVAAACTGCSDPTPGKQITCSPFGSL
jgi:hypothetical protein